MDLDEIVTMPNGLWMTKAEMAEFATLSDPGEKQRALDYRKKCVKDGISHPIPPSKWLVCPLCGYRAPASLVSHIKTHGGLDAMAAQLGVLRETIQIVTPELLQSQRERSIAIAADLKAKKEAEKVA